MWETTAPATQVDAAMDRHQVADVPAHLQALEPAPPPLRRGELGEHRWPDRVFSTNGHAQEHSDDNQLPTVAHNDLQQPDDDKGDDVEGVQPAPANLSVR